MISRLDQILYLMISCASFDELIRIEFDGRILIIYDDFFIIKSSIIEEDLSMDVGIDRLYLNHSLFLIIYIYLMTIYDNNILFEK